MEEYAVNGKTNGTDRTDRTDERQKTEDRGQRTGGETSNKKLLQGPGTCFTFSRKESLAAGGTMKKSRHNDQIYNLAVCDEGKKVKLFLQFDIDGDGDMDAVVSFLSKKLGGDVEGDIIEKLKRFFDVFGFPKVLIVLSSLLVNKGRWVEGFPEIKRIDIMLPEKKYDVGPVETWYFTMNAVNNVVFMVLRSSEKVLLKHRVVLPVPSMAEEVKDFLLRAFHQNNLPGKVINESPDRFSFNDNKATFDEASYISGIEEIAPNCDHFSFQDISIEVIPVDDKEHLIIEVK